MADIRQLTDRFRSATGADRRAVLVIGLGRFGSALARELIDMGHEVLGVDVDDQLVSRHKDLAHRGANGRLHRSGDAHRAGRSGDSSCRGRHRQRHGGVDPHHLGPLRCGRPRHLGQGPDRAAPTDPRAGRGGPRRPARSRDRSAGGASRHGRGALLRRGREELRDRRGRCSQGAGRSSPVGQPAAQEHGRHVIAIRRPGGPFVHAQPEVVVGSGDIVLAAGQIRDVEAFMER